LDGVFFTVFRKNGVTVGTEEWILLSNPDQLKALVREAFNSPKESCILESLLPFPWQTRLLSKEASARAILEADLVWVNNFLGMNKNRHENT
jgi:hypothetical protein